MFESTLAERDVSALAEAANDPVIDSGSWDPPCAPAETCTRALLQSVTARTRRRDAAAVRFEDSGAALFRPFRVY